MRRGRYISARKIHLRYISASGSPSEGVASLTFQDVSPGLPSDEPRRGSVQKRGHCFVMVNYEFQKDSKGKPEDLIGYKNDVKEINKVFKKLNFDVKIKQNRTSDEIKSDVRIWCKTDFSDDKLVVVFLLSHGNKVSFL